jgi:hypothetical protein
VIIQKEGENTVTLGRGNTDGRLEVMQRKGIHTEYRVDIIPEYRGAEGGNTERKEGGNTERREGGNTEGGRQKYREEESGNTEDREG